MHLSKFALSLAYVFWPAAAGAQTADIDYIVDTMVRLCLAGGRTEAFSGGGSVGADLSLRSQDVRGNLEGEFRVENSKVEGLVEGINSAMSQVAADQADKVRSCLQPLRNRILHIYLPARAWQNAPEPPTDAPTAELLYETGIGKGRFQGWSLTPDWKRLSNGMLVNDGTGPYSRFAPIFAPYQPEAADYAVETEIRVIQDYASSFGVVVRANGKGGYAVGLGGGWNRTTNICYLGGWWGTNDRNDCKAAGQAFDPGTDWHKYRVEAKANTITLSIDGAVMTNVADNRFLSSGRVGLWSNRYQLEVRNFRVVQLQSK